MLLTQQQIPPQLPQLQQSHPGSPQRDAGMDEHELLMAQLQNVLGGARKDLDELIEETAQDGQGTITPRREQGSLTPALGASPPLPVRSVCPCMVSLVLHPCFVLLLDFG